MRLFLLNVSSNRPAYLGIEKREARGLVMVQVNFTFAFITSSPELSSKMMVGTPTKPNSWQTSGSLMTPRLVARVR